MEEFENRNEKPMSVKDWLVTFLILVIPVVGFVMLFVYAFGSDQNANRQNWAKAQLIMCAIVCALIWYSLQLSARFSLRQWQETKQCNI